MIYDTSKEHEKQQAITRFNHLVQKSKRIDLKVKHPKRSISQNAYLHLILSAFGCEFGYSLEEVKQEIFKKVVNKEIFYDGEKDGIITIQQWRSTADLDTGELTTAINRFLNYSAQNGYRLPEPSDLLWIEELEKEVSKNKQFL